ncbi:alpha/beta fold hydrolase [Vallitalea guaymasensis]|uniref:alpha/beta fold hydrolase n=1 Tax=Vallitalea guaymasensis TaxID=1185412 RepID=UPI000DE2D330|nr:alpha/beta hydrolase [Vallitalea guaymasensis]
MKTNSIYKSDEGKALIINHYDNLIKKWPVDKEIFNVNTSFGNTFIIASGDIANKPIILLHGSSTNSVMWMGDVEKLSKTYRVYAIDIIGEPGKSDENRPDMNGDHYGKWLDEIIDALNIEKAIIIGNSLGGWMALKYATYKPEKVEKLVLLAPSGITNGKISFMFRVMPLMLLGEKGIDRLNRIVYGKEKIPEEALEFGKLIMKHYRPRMGSLPVLTDQELSKLTMPTLYMGGENDALLPTKKIADRISRIIPKAKIKVLKNTGHVLIDVVDDVVIFLGG